MPNFPCNMTENYFLVPGKGTGNGTMGTSQEKINMKLFDCFQDKYHVKRFLVLIQQFSSARTFATCMYNYQQRNDCQSSLVSSSDLHQNVLIVLAYNPIDNVYYGISTNKKTFLRSKSFPFSAWTAISNNIWFRVKESSSLITATEVPFIPALPGNVHEPFAALTLPRVGVPLKRRRRSVVSVDMWGCNYLTVLYQYSSL